MKRATRSSIGHPTGDEGQLSHEHIERATRSRKASDDLVVLELPRITRTRGTNSKSPEPPKSSQRSGGKAGAADSGHKHEKRGLSPEEPSRGTSAKRRRRSGRLAETETADPQEKPDKEKGVQDVDKAGGSHREKLHEEETKSGKEKEKDSKEAKGKAKDCKSEDGSNKEHKKKEESSTPVKESGGSGRRRTRSGRFAAEDEAETTQTDSHPAKTENVEIKIDVGVSEVSAVKAQRTKDSGRSSSKSDKGKGDTTRLRSPPRSPEKMKKGEPIGTEMPKLELDVSEQEGKGQTKHSSKGALTPPLRMSPRRARNPSGQKAAETKKDGKVNKESSSVLVDDGKTKGKCGDELTVKIEEAKDTPKKSGLVCRDISKEFSETKESPRSPTRTSRARKEEDAAVKTDKVPQNESDNSNSLPKSPKPKKGRSPAKHQHDNAQLSPRKGLRSDKASEAEASSGGVAQDQDIQVDVMAMDVEEHASIDILTSVGDAANAEAMVLGVTATTGETPETKREAEAHLTVSDMLCMEEEQKEEDDVTPISDEIAAKIREWKFREEDGVGFQGDEWYSEEVDEGEPFYFESDHMALKGNKDYRMLLRTITTLEAQRKQAVKDLDKLVTAQREALRNPLKFVHKLQKKDTLHLPSAQRIVLLPDIAWGRYLGQADCKELIQGLSHQTRASLKQKGSGTGSHESHRDDAGLGTSTDHMDAQSLDQDEKNKNIIRGRLWDETKPNTFNRLWTVGEQKRLEELLVKYPSEEVEARRWEKIAKDLGNRTRNQVASRVQKYFIKLGKAGLPIPGRMPHMATYTRRLNQRRYPSPFQRLTLAPSTFLQSIRAPVLMTDEDDFFSLDLDYDADSIMEEDDIPVELKDSEEYKELARLKKLRNITLKQQTEASHVGFMCDGCGTSPIVGVRWHCLNCPADVSTDLCQSCQDEDYQSEMHTTSHQLEPVHVTSQSGGFVDSDYTSFTSGTSGDYNYLDPNYSPAVV